MSIPCVQEGRHRIEALRLHCAVVPTVLVMKGLEPPIKERANFGRNFAAEQVPDNGLKPRLDVSNENNKAGIWKSLQQMADDKLIGSGDVILKVKSEIAFQEVGAKGLPADFAL